MSILVRDLTVKNDTANLQQVRAFIADSIGESGLADRSQALLVLAVDEAVTSIIINSVRTGGNGLCHLTVDVDDVRVRVVIDDSTFDTDLTSLSEEALHRHIEAGRAGEMGILLIRAIVDELTYTFRKGFQNQLELVKFIYPES